MTIPFEPLIFSQKYMLVGRRRDLAFFRNKQFYSMLKCRFPSYSKIETPVVLIVKFYVPPPVKCTVTREQVRKEKTPAVLAPELSEYLLSFLEMIYNCLIRSYSQVVKIDMSKFYSAKPRTVFQFMKWSNYEELLHYYKSNPEAKAVVSDQSVKDVQSERCRDGRAPKRSKKTGPLLTIEGPTAGYCPFPLAAVEANQRKKKRTAKLIATRNQARRGQPREVSQRLVQRYSVSGRFTDFVDTPKQIVD